MDTVFVSIMNHPATIKKTAAFGSCLTQGNWNFLLLGFKRGQRSIWTKSYSWSWTNHTHGRLMRRVWQIPRTCSLRSTGDAFTWQWGQGEQQKDLVIDIRLLIHKTVPVRSSFPLGKLFCTLQCASYNCICLHLAMCQLQLHLMPASAVFSFSGCNHYNLPLVFPFLPPKTAWNS